MCNCRAEIEKVLSQKYTNPIIDYSILTVETNTVVTYTQLVRGKPKEKTITIGHTHCPFCGERYRKEETANE